MNLIEKCHFAQYRYKVVFSIDEHRILKLLKCLQIHFEVSLGVYLGMNLGGFMVNQ